MKAVSIKQLTVSSPSFEHEGEIPAKYTCDGLNISPALEISGIPSEAHSLAIIVDDPDAPGGTFDHWLVWNIPPTGSIPENSQPGLEGKNSGGRIGYMGPCPPSGTHRYFFKVYAVNTLLEAEKGASKAKLEYVMKDHVIAYGETMGLYARKQRHQTVRPEEA